MMTGDERADALRDACGLVIALLGCAGSREDLDGYNAILANCGKDGVILALASLLANDMLEHAGADRGRAVALVRAVLPPITLA